jgi:dUTP pyrophosphatase
VVLALGFRFPACRQIFHPFAVRVANRRAPAHCWTLKNPPLDCQRAIIDIPYLPRTLLNPMPTDNRTTVKISRISDVFRDIPLPEYATEGSAGLDLRAAIADTISLDPGEIRAVPTNIAIELPGDLEAQVRPRSGLALSHGITMPNTPGTIDSDYRGEIIVILANMGKQPFAVKRGERIAQLVIAPIVRIRWEEAEALSSTIRSGGGFGHSGRS